jgi:NTE family protein
MAKTKSEKHLAVALQGGGSHGAFTWGVLDRLLEEEDLHLDGFSGTSAGAMNAAVLAYGLMEGGKPLARELLTRFWQRVSEYASTSPLQPAWWDAWLGQGNMDYSPGYLLSEVTSIFLAPTQLNPLNLNPLRDILQELVDFKKLQSCEVTKIFVAATNVRRGRVKVFRMSEVSCQAVLASACLPYLYRAVTIDGEDYWDGGFMGNPPIYPLIDGTDCSDILLVQINPINIHETPTTATEIRDRVNELSFNSSLMLEMRRIHFVDKMLEQGINPEGKFRKIFFHNINPEMDMQALNVSSKYNARWTFLSRLRDLGRDYAEQWLGTHYESIGQRSTVDLKETFL